MTSDVRLRDVTEADLPIFFEHQLDPDATQMAAFSSRERDAFMAHWAKILADPTGGKQTILVDERVAGNIVSFEQSGEREVGYWLGRDYWGRGVATQALAAFLAQETARPLYVFVAKHNVGSRRVLEKCGFTIYGEEGEGIILKLSA
jgi:RimJ/RimL family protein N-acetyltransferase